MIYNQLKQSIFLARGSMRMIDPGGFPTEIREAIEHLFDQYAQLLTMCDEAIATETTKEERKDQGGRITISD